METLQARFRYLDPRFFPYLERVLNRVPLGIKEDILKREDFQLIGDDGFLDQCMLSLTFERPVRSFCYINTKILRDSDHGILLAVASQMAFYCCSQEKPEPECHDAEELLKQWGFQEELDAVRRDEIIARSEEYQIGYKWARRQDKDYLVQHFGLYFDRWNTRGWGRGSEALEQKIEGRNGTSSLLEELAKGRSVVATTMSGTPANSASPRRAVLAGIMSAMKEIELQERFSPRVCEMTVERWLH
jgi:hypothetical protein